ncbi:hypothetical protein DICSQDRAFT_55007 [Dichomitus squalens LYAD-421 SS1]|uniref:uncharacterized protein n=1 Tax=Dichomitus squalens (strain LYAD-421) TaxID=732165 RepID=UPI0004414147|nr:uncharacterized protein DICSQDRAFT_55007 [Dichomitus squalens LYAD-421 SS1]EJF63727.1 hypothetical protein DICSQDRAFT_55007 [Dichomitus squalens LYAD-421 SS1]
MIRAPFRLQTSQLARRPAVATSQVSKQRYWETSSDKQNTVQGPSAVHPLPLPPDTPILLLKTKAVPDAPTWLTSAPDKFLEYLRSPNAAPVIIRARKDKDDHLAETLLCTLRAAPSERLVEVETGKWDRKHGWDDRISCQLGVFLDWLTDQRKLSANEEQRMLYLAQWRAHEDVPGLQDVVKPPGLIVPLLQQEKADLYQSAFFVGPVGVVSALHTDPYHNLYNLFSSSEPSLFGKHFVLLPPSMSPFLERKDSEFMRNTSHVECFLKATSSDTFDVAIDPDMVPAKAARAMLASDSVLSCMLQEGDTIFVPRRWWHRVENVMAPSAARHGKKRGWTAGVGWWFLPRSS